MIPGLVLTTLLFAAPAVFAAMSETLPPYRQPARPIEQRTDDLLARMTLEEKIHQLHQGSVGDTNPNNLGERAGDFRPTDGSYIVGGPSIHGIRNLIQRRALEESRLGIPVTFGADVIHGYRTILPIPLAQACTWNPELVRQGAALAAREASAQGVDWTFAPMVDHCVDPRWGRIAETFGESPYASGVFAVASVAGYQGDDLSAPDSLASCLKHYVGYGASEGGRDYSATDISAQSLWDQHLPAFEAGVRAGARTVMSAFNDLNGIPASANHYTLTEVLRDEWGFDGVVVSDWNAVLQLRQQGFAADEKEAVERALTAGVDLNMADGLYVRHLGELVESQRVPLALLDEAVRRVLRLKFELGLFERPLTESSPLTDAAPTAEHLAVAEEMAVQSMVLLENKGILPLSGAGRIAVIGPLADHRAALLGSWAQQGRAEETPTLLEALRAACPPSADLRFARGCSSFQTDDADIPAAVAVAREAEVVVLCVGEEAWMSGENASRTSLRLPGTQEQLVEAILATGRPTVMVIVSGRPVELQAFTGRVDAIVAAWQGGTRAGPALASLLLGRRNFAGRLAVTWPRLTGQIPLYHHMRPRARLDPEGEYQDAPTTPLYAFGHGLGYSEFSYGAIRLDRATVTPGEQLVAEVTVTNVGVRAGAETVHWFIHDPAASITRPWRELKHFEKARVPAGGSHTFRFVIDPARDFSFPNSNGRRVLEPGEIVLFAGPGSARFRVGSDTTLSSP